MFQIIKPRHFKNISFKLLYLSHYIPVDIYFHFDKFKLVVVSMNLLSIIINTIKQIRCEFPFFFFCFFFIDIFIVWKSFIKNLEEFVYLKHIHVLCIYLAHTRCHN